jgi:excisionase family DNA binding protein
MIDHSFPVSTVLPATDQNLRARDESAQFLGISTRLLDQFVLDGELPAVRIGRRVLFDPADLIAFRNARKTAAK